VGLKVSLAFEKPVEYEEGEISWRFKRWVESTLKTDYYAMRSKIVPICMEMIEELQGSHSGEVRKPAEEIISENVAYELEEVLARIIELFPHNEWCGNNESLCKKIMKECLHLCEKLDKAEKELRHGGWEGAGKAVLKIARNWMSHQGINVTTSYEAVFIYYIFMRVFFDVNKSDKVNERLQTLVSEYNKENKKIPYEEIKKMLEKMEEKYRTDHKEAYDKFVREVGVVEAKKVEKIYSYKEGASICATISAIGNRYSPIRDCVSMEHLYVLFLSVLDEKMFGEESIFQHTVANHLGEAIENYDYS